MTDQPDNPNATQEDHLTEMLLSEHFAPGDQQAPDMRERIAAAVEQAEEAAGGGRVHSMPLARWSVAAGLLLVLGLSWLVLFGNGDEPSGKSEVEANAEGDGESEGDSEDSKDEGDAVNTLKEKTPQTAATDGELREIKARDLEHAKELIRNCKELYVQPSMTTLFVHYFPGHEYWSPLKGRYHTSPKERAAVIEALAESLAIAGEYHPPLNDYILYFDQGDGRSYTLTLCGGRFLDSGLLALLEADNEKVQRALHDVIPKSLVYAKQCYGVISYKEDTDRLAEDTPAIYVVEEAVAKSQPGFRGYLPLLAKFTNLKELVLVGPTVDEDLELLKIHSSLESLHFAGPHFDGSGLGVLRNLTNLKRLAIQIPPKLSKVAFTNIAAAPALENLEIRFFHYPTFGIERGDISDEAVASLSKATKLKKLSLINAGELGSKAFVGWEILKSLKELDLTGCRLDKSAIPTLNWLGQLEVLRLKGNSTLKDSDLATLELESFVRLGGKRSRVHRLRVLDLSEISDVGEKTVKTLIKCYGQSLQELSLASTSVDDACISTLDRLLQIEILKLSNTAITDECASSIAAMGTSVVVGFAPHTSTLRQLDLSNCKKITDKLVLQLAKQTNLETINLRGCDGVSEEACSKLAAALPKCQITTPKGKIALPAVKDTNALKGGSEADSESSPKSTTSIVGGRIEVASLEEAQVLLRDTMQLYVVQEPSWFKFVLETTCVPLLDFGEAILVANADEKKAIVDALMKAELSDEASTSANNYSLSFLLTEGRILRVEMSGAMGRFPGMNKWFTLPLEGAKLGRQLALKSELAAKRAYGIIESYTDLEALPADTKTVVVSRAAFGKSKADEFEGQPLPLLRKFTGLKHLTIHGQIRDERLRHLAQHPTLESLTLVDNVITGKGLEVLKELKSLKRLKLIDVRNFEKVGFTNIAAAPALEELSIQPKSYFGYSELPRDDWLAELSKAINLQKLAILRAGSFTEKAFEGWWNKIRNLRELDLSETDITDAAFHKLLREVPKLSSLRLMGQERLSDKGIAAAIRDRGAQLPRAASTWSVASFINVRSLSAESCRELGTFADSLTYLDLSGTAIDDACIEQLTKLRFIRTLKLARTGITDECAKWLVDVGRHGPMHLGTLSSHLRHLDLSGCEKITDNLVGELAKIKELELLNLQGCKEVSEEACIALSKKLPSCQITTPAGRTVKGRE